MPLILRILERKDVPAYLKARGLLKQYMKAKAFLLSGNMFQVNFKERNPKGSEIWSFRINKQFRALCTFIEKGDLIVYEIDNHQ